MQIACYFISNQEVIMDSEMKRKETKRWTAKESYSFSQWLKMHKDK